MVLVQDEIEKLKQAIQLNVSLKKTVDSLEKGLLEKEAVIFNLSEKVSHHSEELNNVRKEKEEILKKSDELLHQLDIEKKIHQELSQKLDQFQHVEKTPLSDQKEAQSLRQNTSIIKEHPEVSNPQSNEHLQQSYIDQIRELTKEKNKLIDALKVAQSRVSDAEKEISSLQQEFNKSQIQQKFFMQSQIQGQRKMVILWQSLLGVVLILVAFLLYK